MEARNNGDRRSWRSQYRDHTHTTLGYSSSGGYTSAGTIVSTTGYTSNSSRRLSSFSLSLKADIHLELELDEDEDMMSQPTKKSRKETETSKGTQKKEEMYHQEIIAKTKEMEDIRILVQEFLGAPSPSPSVDCSIPKAKGGDTSVLDWWLEHLGVGWVLHIADDYASSGKLFEHTFDRHAWSWIWALAKISKTVRFVASADLPSSICAEEGQQPEIGTGNKDSTLNLFQFAQFIQETMLKLLVFVDAIVASNAKITLQEQEVISSGMNRRVLQLYHKLRTLVGVHGALSDALLAIQWLLGSRPHTTRGVEMIQEMTVSILKGKVATAAKGIRSTLEQTFVQIRVESIDDRDDSSCSLNTQGSSDVHKATRFVIEYIRLLGKHCSLEQYDQGDCVQYTRNACQHIRISIQEMLVNISESFLNHGLRFLFLLNNSYFIRMEVPYGTTLFCKVEGYMESYLQVSWAPVLSCLSNPPPICFGRKSSLLPKFESEFQKTYTTQKLWKVPDPKHRKILRKAIIEKIVPGYTNYIKDNKITAPKFSPRELKEMLEELFEG